MLHGKGSQVGIGDEFRPETGVGPDQVTQEGGVAIAGARDPHVLQGQPARDALPDDVGRRRAGEDAGIGEDPQSGEQGRPGKADLGSAGQLAVEPLPGGRVLGGVGGQGVDQ